MHIGMFVRVMLLLFAAGAIATPGHEYIAVVEYVEYCPLELQLKSIQHFAPWITKTVPLKRNYTTVDSPAEFVNRVLAVFADSNVVVASDTRFVFVSHCVYFVSHVVPSDYYSAHGLPRWKVGVFQRSTAVERLHQLKSAKGSSSHVMLRHARLLGLQEDTVATVVNNASRGGIEALVPSVAFTDVIAMNVGVFRAMLHEPQPMVVNAVHRYFCIRVEQPHCTGPTCCVELAHVLLRTDWILMQTKWQLGNPTPVYSFIRSCTCLLSTTDEFEGTGNTKLRLTGALGANIGEVPLPPELHTCNRVIDSGYTLFQSIGNQLFAPFHVFQFRRDSYGVPTEAEVARYQSIVERDVNPFLTDDWVLPVVEKPALPSPPPVFKKHGKKSKHHTDATTHTHTHERKNLMLIAHPDDDTLWAGDVFFTHRDHPWHVICLTCPSNTRAETPRLRARSQEFHRLLGIVGATGEGWGFVDKMAADKGQSKLAGHKIRKLVTSKHWNMAFVQHVNSGPYQNGQYIHPQHTLLYSQAIRAWCTMPHQFPPLYTSAYAPLNGSLHTAKVQLQAHYPSQSHIVGTIIRHTQLNFGGIVPVSRDYCNPQPSK